MIHQRLSIEFASGDDFDEFCGWVLLASFVDVFVEPGFQSVELTLFELQGEVSELVSGCRVELGGVDVAEGVGGEVANQPG